MKVNEIKISVIIPAYNSESSIDKCLNSVIRQKYKNYEIIVINDGSNDKTNDLIVEFINNNSNLNIIYLNEKNGGVSHARNLGLNKVTGDVITFLDSDDFYDDGFFESINRNFGRNDILLYGYRTIFNQEICDIRYGKDLVAKSNVIFKELSKHNLFNPVCNKVYSKNIIKNIEFNEKLDLGEDFLFFTNALYNSNNIKYIDEIYYNYEINLNGLGFKRRNNMFLSKVIGMNGLLKLYKDNEYDIRDISGMYVKNMLSDFMTELIDKNLDKKKIIELQKKCSDEFDFFELEYKLQYRILLNLYLSRFYFFIYVVTKFLYFYDKFNKKRKFKIKR